MEDKRTKFMSIYANVPEDLRGDIVASVDGEPYTWKSAYLEIKDNTEKGREILKVLGEVGVV